MQDMLTDPLANIVLMHADDKLMLGHIQSDWTGLAPILEEDIAASAKSSFHVRAKLSKVKFAANWQPGMYTDNKPPP